MIRSSTFYSNIIAFRPNRDPYMNCTLRIVRWGAWSLTDPGMLAQVSRPPSVQL